MSENHDKKENGDPERIVKTFRVTFTEEEWERYKIVKADLGLSADAEVIRYLIHLYYKIVVMQGEQTSRDLSRLFKPI